MSVAIYIARRYLFAKKSHNAINLISAISFLGIMIGTMALIVVLSVFNGFEGLVLNLFNHFNPDLKIIAVEGKFFPASALPADKIAKYPDVAYYSGVLEEKALIRYKERQNVLTMKGVDPAYGRETHLDSSLTNGVFVLEEKGVNYAVPGYGIAYLLNIQLNDLKQPLEVYYPRSVKPGLMNAGEAFTIKPVFSSGIFSVQQEFDSRYVFVSLHFMEELLNKPAMLSYAEIRLKPGTDPVSIQQSLQQLCGSKFKVLNRFQQDVVLYKILKSEKWAIFLILSFILLIATFNVVGSLTMLILDKRKDMAVMWSMGAETGILRKIFLTEGLFIGLGGAITGLFLGGLISYLQQRFGLLSLGPEQGSFLVDAYPVKMKIIDFITVFLTVSSITLLATWFSVRKISSRYLEKRSLS